MKSERVDPDLAAVEAARNGDHQAFRLLYERHRSFVFHVIRQMIGNHEDSLDLVQEVFIKVHRNLAGFEGKSLFRTWLGRIAHNAAIDFCKKRRVNVRLSLDARHGEDDRIIPEPGMDDDPSASLNNQELHRQLEQAMVQLSDPHREVIRLYATEELTYQEIADMLAVSVGTVMSRLFYARQHLKKLMQPHLATEVQDD